MNCIFQSSPNLELTISQMADFHVSVKADHCHSDETTTSEEEADPSIPLTDAPAKHPAMAETGYDGEWFSRHCNNIESNQ